MSELTPKQIAAIEFDIQDSPEFWEEVRREAESLLATVSPRTRTAKVCRQHLAEYQQWRERWEEQERLRLIPSTHKWCSWSKSPDGTYAIKTPKKARPGDAARVTLSDGSTRLYRLTEGGDGVWTGYLRIDQQEGS